MAPPRLLIFDFDGVVADSEAIANRALADYLTSKGHPTTLDDAIRLFMGKRHQDTLAEIVRYTGQPLPDDFETAYRAQVKIRMRRDVRPVDGVAGFLATNALPARCVASSSGLEWLDHCVDKFGFRTHFGNNLFSAQFVANGKPAPDIFLHAAAVMDVSPAHTLVLEDSTLGVQGARAAGMHVVGFLGGSHIRDGHGDRLLEAGAHSLAATYEDVARLIA